MFLCVAVVCLIVLFAVAAALPFLCKKHEKVVSHDAAVVTLLFKFKALRENPCATAEDWKVFLPECRVVDQTLLRLHGEEGWFEQYALERIDACQKK